MTAQTESRIQSDPGFAFERLQPRERRLLSCWCRAMFVSAKSPWKVTAYGAKCGFENLTGYISEYGPGLFYVSGAAFTGGMVAAGFVVNRIGVKNDWHLYARPRFRCTARYQWDDVSRLPDDALETIRDLVRLSKEAA